MADYSKAIELKPNDAEPLLARGKLFAQQAYWTKAVIDFAKSLEFETNWPVAGWHALALAGASQTKEHRKTCTTLLQHLKEADGRFAASLVVWFCVRFPEAVADPARPLELAEKAVNSHPKDHFSLKNLGAALYRANRFEESIKKLNEAMQARGLEDTETAKDWLFLTMAHHRLGHAEEAKKWLTKAQEWIDQATQEKPKDRTVANRLSWDQRLELKLIRAEAEALLKEDPKK